MYLATFGLKNIVDQKNKTLKPLKVCLLKHSTIRPEIILN